VIRARLASLLLASLILANAHGADEEPPRIRIKGVGGELEANIRAHLSITGRQCAVAQWRRQAVLDQSREEADAALRALGYYDAEIAVSLERKAGCWALRLDVQPGEPVRVAQAQVEVIGDARDDPAFRRLLDDLPVKVGERLDHGQYERIKQRLSQLALGRGYFDARFVERALRVYPEQREARIHIRYDSGSRYDFGEVRLETEALSKRFVDRFVELRPGEPYRSEALVGLQQALLDSGYFSDVRIRQQVEEARDQRVPIDVRVTARKRHAYSIGAGFATDTGPRLRLGYRNRRVNRSGHRYQARIEGSPVRTQLSMAYEIPLADPLTERLDLKAGYLREETDNTDSRTYKLGAARTKRHPSGWLHTLGLDFQRELFELGDDDESADLLLPSIGVSRTEADDSVSPQRGWRVSLDLRGAVQGVLSDADFAQIHARGKYIRPAPGGRLLLRGELGASEADPFARIPTSLRFFAGGDTSVRGYDYRSLGPEDSDGDVVGGRHLVVGSVEYEYRVLPDWSVATFFDAGNAFNDVEAELAEGVGIGVRWHSPIGPVRLDLAHPLDGKGIRIHFTMGPDL